jgi:hypothetical protein
MLKSEAIALPASFKEIGETYAESVSTSHTTEVGTRHPPFLPSASKFQHQPKQFLHPLSWFYSQHPNQFFLDLIPQSHDRWILQATIKVLESAHTSHITLLCPFQEILANFNRVSVFREPPWGGRRAINRL